MTHRTNYCLNVRNIRQLILWKTELMGQISDGHWENASPHNHWEDWASAKVEVNPDNVGVNFIPWKNNYNFLSGELLEVVGDRMIFKTRAAVMFENVDGFADWLATNGWDLPDSVEDYDSYVRSAKSEPTGYFGQKIEMLNQLGITREVMVEIATTKGVYDKRDLVSDLRDLKEVIRTQQHPLA